MTIYAIKHSITINNLIAQILTKAEIFFCILGLLYFTGSHNALIEFFLGIETENLVSSILRYLVLFGSFLLLAFRWRLSISVARRGILLWLLILINGLSYFWSELPEWTLLSVRGELLPMTFFGLYLASRFSLRQQIRMLVIFLTVCAILSTLVVFVLPEVGRHPITEFEGAWRGLFPHKNGLSAYMSLTVLAYLSILLGQERQKIIYHQLALFGLLLTQGLIILSTSLTGIVLSLFSLFFLIAYRQYQWQGKRSILTLDFFVIILIFIVSLVALNWDFLLEWVGKDPTLTGRTLIWKYAIEFWIDKFWLGYGRDVFWHEDLSYGFLVGRKIAHRFIVPHSHNSFIEMALDMGAIGLGIFLIGFFKTIVRSFRMVYLQPTSNFLWCCGFLSITLIFSFSESILLRKSSFFFVLYMSIYLSLLLPEREFLKKPIDLSGE